MSAPSRRQPVRSSRARPIGRPPIAPPTGPTNSAAAAGPTQSTAAAAAASSTAPPGRRAGPDSPTENKPGFFPALTHFTDSLAALPREVIRHFTMMNEVEAKDHAANKELAKMADALLGLTSAPDNRLAQPDRPGRNGGQPDHSSGSAVTSYSSVSNGAGLNRPAGQTSAPASSDAGPPATAPPGTSNGPIMPRNLSMAEQRAELLRRMIYTLITLSPVMDEKIGVLAAANVTVDKQLRRMSSSYAAVEKEISDEARLGSLTHWALQDREEKEAAAAAVQARTSTAPAASAGKEPPKRTREDDDAKKTQTRTRKSAIANEVENTKSASPQPQKRRKTEKEKADRADKPDKVEKADRADKSEKDKDKKDAKERKGRATAANGRKRGAGQSNGAVSVVAAPTGPNPASNVPTPASPVKEPAVELKPARGSDQDDTEVGKPEPEKPPVVQEVVEDDKVEQEVESSRPAKIDTKVNPEVVAEPAEKPEEPKARRSKASSGSGGGTGPATANPSLSPSGSAAGSNGNRRGLTRRTPVLATTRTRRRRDEDAEPRPESRATADSTGDVDMDGRPDGDMDQDGDGEGDGGDDVKYCYCHQVSYGEMVACDNGDCPTEWFHLKCAGLKEAPPESTSWYCDHCARVMSKSTKSDDRREKNGRKEKRARRTD